MELLVQRRGGESGEGDQGSEREDQGSEMGIRAQRWGLGLGYGDMSIEGQYNAGEGGKGSKVVVR